jgi:hypothetical protein
LVTASEVQTFTNNAASMGMPEAGAMAALLGGTATYSAVEPGINNTVFNENPDDPAAEQRRFNFFDYAADGQLNGSITMNELKMLSRVLLPSPDAYAVTDRQRASANGFLLDPTAQRNIVALQHILPTFEWVPKSAVAKYRNISPMKFGFDKGIQPGHSFPLYTLFDPATTPTPTTGQTTVVTASKVANVGGVPIKVEWVSNIPVTSLSTSGLAAATTTALSTPTSVTPAGTLTSTSAASSAGGTASPTPSTPAPTTVLGTATPNPSATTPASSPTSTSTGTTGTTTPAVSAPVTAAVTPTTAASTPPPEAVDAVPKRAPAKAKSKNSVSGFFSDLGKSIKKAFG